MVLPAETLVGKGDQPFEMRPKVWMAFPERIRFRRLAEFVVDFCQATPPEQSFGLFSAGPAPNKKERVGCCRPQIRSLKGELRSGQLAGRVGAGKSLRLLTRSSLGETVS